MQVKWHQAFLPAIQKRGPHAALPTIRSKQVDVLCFSPYTAGRRQLRTHTTQDNTTFFKVSARSLACCVLGWWCQGSSLPWLSGAPAALALHTRGLSDIHMLPGRGWLGAKGPESRMRKGSSCAPHTRGLCMHTRGLGGRLSLQYCPDHTPARPYGSLSSPCMPCGDAWGVTRGGG